MHVYVLMIYTQYIAALGDQFKFIWEEEGLELRQEFVIFRYCWSGFWFSVLWYSVSWCPRRDGVVVYALFGEDSFILSEEF